MNFRRQREENLFFRKKLTREYRRANFSQNKEISPVDGVLHI